MITTQRASKSNTTFVNSIVSVFLFISLIGIINHEMWRDELHAWMIARDSSSIIDLFKNLRYEGHPGLWHSCLYFITRFTRNPMAMQFFHLLIATGVIYLFAKFSPFTKLQKILFTFSYFPLYEYNIISRNYSLGVLLIFLFCIFFPRRNQSYLVLSILLSLLANTHAYGLMIAICLAMTLAFEIIIDKNIYRLFSNSRRWDLIISSIIFIFSVVIAIIQIIPPSSAAFAVNQQISIPSKLSKIKHLAFTLLTIWRSYIPIPNFFDYNFWNTNILMEGHGILKICALVFSLCLLFFSITLFIQKPVALFLYLSGTLSILLFIYVKHFGYLRHHGHLFILFLTCIWISAYYSKSDFLSRRFKTLTKFVNQHKNQYLSILLSIHVLAGIFAFSMDFTYPFSASKEVANFIKSKRLNDTLIVGSTGFQVSPLAALLDRKIYYLESDKLSTFIVWNNIKTLSNQEVLDKINKLITQKEQNILLVLNYKLDAERPELSISKLSKSSKSIEPKETYHLYLIQRKPPKSLPD